jgi:hypothetical protein
MDLKDETGREKAVSLLSEAEARRKLKNARKRAEKRRKQKEKKLRDAIKSTDAAVVSAITLESAVRDQLFRSILMGSLTEVQQLLNHPSMSLSVNESLHDDSVIGLPARYSLLHTCVSDLYGIDSSVPKSEVVNSRLEITKFLLNHSAPSLDAGIVDFQGCTALHIACKYGDFAIVQLLLAERSRNPSRKVQIDLISYCHVKGWTPLHYATYYSYPDICKCLVQNGCDPMVPELKDGVVGCTPLELVRKSLIETTLSEAQAECLSSIENYFQSVLSGNILCDKNATNSLECTVPSVEDNEDNAEDKKKKKKKSKKKKAEEFVRAVPAAHTSVTVDSSSLTSVANLSRDELVGNLISMGFEESDCIAAVIACGKDADRAISWLCERSEKLMVEPLLNSGEKKVVANHAPETTLSIKQKIIDVAARAKREQDSKEELRRINRAWNAKAEEEKRRTEMERRQKEVEKLQHQHSKTNDQSANMYIPPSGASASIGQIQLPQERIVPGNRLDFSSVPYHLTYPLPTGGNNSFRSMPVAEGVPLLQAPNVRQQQALVNGFIAQPVYAYGPFSQSHQQIPSTHMSERSAPEVAYMARADHSRFLRAESTANMPLSVNVDLTACPQHNGVPMGVLPTSLSSITDLSSADGLNKEARPFIPKLVALPSSDLNVIRVESIPRAPDVPFQRSTSASPLDNLSATMLPSEFYHSTFDMSPVSLDLIGAALDASEVPIGFRTKSPPMSSSILGMLNIDPQSPKGSSDHYDGSKK